MPTPGQPSIAQGPEASPPAATLPPRLYTEAEALTAAEAAAMAALDEALPLAVQAAVAEERGRAAADRVMSEAALAAARKSIDRWRLATLGATAALASALLYCAATR